MSNLSNNDPETIFQNERNKVLNEQPVTTLTYKEEVIEENNRISLPRAPSSSQRTPSSSSMEETSSSKSPKPISSHSSNTPKPITPTTTSGAPEPISSSSQRTPKPIYSSSLKTPNDKITPVMDKITPVMENNSLIKELIKFSNNKMSMNPIYTNMPLSSFTRDSSHSSQKIAIMPIPFVYTLDWTALNNINNIDYPINKVTEVNFNNEEDIIDEEGIINDEVIIKQNISANEMSNSDEDENRPSYTIPPKFYGEDEEEESRSGLASSMNRPSGVVNNPADKPADIPNIPVNKPVDRSSSTRGRSSYTIPPKFYREDEEDESEEDDFLHDLNLITSFKEVEKISPIDYDPANTLTRLEFIERMNVDDVERVKEFVDANQDTGIFKYPGSTSAFITDLMNKREEGTDEIINRVTYSTYHPFMSGIEVPGRLRCSKNSVFNLQRLIRNSLINNNYIDVDMVNAHLNILKNILNIYLPNYKSDKNFKYIDVLISQRNDLIARMKWLFMHSDNVELSKLDCKNFIFGSMYSYQRFDKVIADSKITNQKIEDLISHTEIKDEKKNIRVFSYFFLKWFIKKDNDIHLNTAHLNDPNYNMRLTNFVVLWNNISNSIRNIQIFITLLHENGVRMTAENKNYSIGKKFTKEAHSYISTSNNKSIVYKEDEQYYEISDNVFADDDIRVVPNVIPPSTTHNLYFYLYNTSLRQQLRHRCFDDNIEADDKIYYKTDILENCYVNFNVMFRLIMNEYEKTMLWHCINYTMKKLNINDELHAVLCHDGFMLDREYFDDGRLNYTTYLCDLKNYIEEETGFNVNFEYKDHCDEMIDTIECVNAAANYSCDDSHNYNKTYDENYIYIPKSKKQIASITEKWNISNPDTVTDKINGEEVTRNIYKMYYNADNNNYYHFANNKPTQPNDNMKYNKTANTRIEYDEEADRKGNFEYSDITEFYPSYNEVPDLIVFDKEFNEYFE